nr:MAG TPA: hypothetical protein [Caudoviricetes sp.]
MLGRYHRNLILYFSYTPPFNYLMQNCFQLLWSLYATLTTLMIVIRLFHNLICCFISHISTPLNCYSFLSNSL